MNKVWPASLALLRRMRHRRQFLGLSDNRLVGCMNPLGDKFLKEALDFLGISCPPNRNFW